jgi:hypothetical protein
MRRVKEYDSVGRKWNFLCQTWRCIKIIAVVSYILARYDSQWILRNKLHLFLRTQDRFILIAPYVYATRCGYFSGYHEACQ